MAVVSHQSLRLCLFVVLMRPLLLIGRDSRPSAAKVDLDVSGQCPCSRLVVCLSGNDRDCVSVCIGGTYTNAQSSFDGAMCLRTATLKKFPCRRMAWLEHVSENELVWKECGGRISARDQEMRDRFEGVRLSRVLRLCVVCGVLSRCRSLR